MIRRHAHHWLIGPVQADGSAEGCCRRCPARRRFPDAVFYNDALGQASRQAMTDYGDLADRLRLAGRTAGVAAYTGGQG